MLDTVLRLVREKNRIPYSIPKTDKIRIKGVQAFFHGIPGLLEGVPLRGPTNKYCGQSRDARFVNDDNMPSRVSNTSEAVEFESGLLPDVPLADSGEYMEWNCG